MEAHVRRVPQVQSHNELMPQPVYLRIIGPEEDTFRIMLATDNHIGYLERDPIRGQDSINTFKEILQLAVKHDVSARNLVSSCAVQCAITYALLYYMLSS